MSRVSCEHCKGAFANIKTLQRHHRSFCKVLKNKLNNEKLSIDNNFENDPMVESATPHRASNDVNGLKLTSQPSSNKRKADTDNCNQIAYSFLFTILLAS